MHSGGSLKTFRELWLYSRWVVVLLSVYLHSWYSKITLFPPLFLAFHASPWSPVAAVSCQCPFCSEMLWGGAGDNRTETMAQGKGRGPDCMVVFDAPVRMGFFYFSFFRIWALNLFMLHLYMYSCSCSCSSKLFYLTVQAIFSRPHKHFSAIPLSLNFAFFFLYSPLSYYQDQVPKQWFSTQVIVSLLSWSCTFPAKWLGLTAAFALSWSRNGSLAKPFLACELCALVTETSHPLLVVGKTQVLALVGANPGLSYTFLSFSERIKLLKVPTPQFCTGQRGGRIWHLSCNNKGSRRCKIWVWDSKHFFFLS